MTPLASLQFSNDALAAQHSYPLSSVVPSADYSLLSHLSYPSHLFSQHLTFNIQEIVMCASQ